MPAGDAADLAAFLTVVPLFAQLDDGARARIATHAQRTRVAAGEWLLREGDPGDRMYVVRWGRLHVLREGAADLSDGSTVLQVLTSGASFGEVALLTGGRRSASVHAVRDSELWSIDRSELLRLLDDPAFALALVSALGLRLSESGATAPQAPTRRTVVTVAPWSPDVPVDELVAVLARELAPRVSVLRVVDVRATDPERVGTDAAQLLDGHEASSDVVLLVTAPGPPAAAGGDVADVWGRFCLRQADRVVVLASAWSPVPTADRSVPRCHLVWCADRLASAAQLHPWFAYAGLCSVHPLRPGSFDADAARCARRLGGRALGLVLSGGGARALAHVGVLAALEEAGVAVDRLGGTSAGAFVAALSATGRSWQDVEATCRAELVRRKPFTDYGIPRSALIRGDRAKAMLRRVFGDQQAETLPRSWFAITADLVAGEPVVHRRGPLHRVVGASMALPGLAPPQWNGRRLLTDGGVLNNLPVDVMAADDEGPVVAVDVMRRWDRAVVPPALPGIVDTIAAASGVGGRQGAERNRELADHLVTPALDDVGLLDWDRMDAIVAAGRQATLAALDEIAEVASGRAG